MKIAVYSHYFVPEIGAPSARFHDLAREWIHHGDSVQIVTCVPNHPTGVVYPGYRKAFYQRESIDQIEVHRAWTYVTPNKGFVKKTIGHISFWPSAILASRRHMRETPDVLIGTSPTFFAAMAANHVARVRRRPFVMEVRDLWPALLVELGVLRNRPAIAALEKLELSLYRDATRVVTVTEAFRRDLIRRGIPENKVQTIPNGADIEYWRDDGERTALRQRLGIGDELVVLYIGAHGISQSLTSVLRSAARLRERADIRFIFVGEGAEKDMLVDIARRENLSNVMFVDPVGKEEVRAWYSCADVCLVPLRNIPLFDTFIPSKMFEILSMQRPIIGSVRGEAAEILTRSGAAIIVPPEDDEAIARAVMQLQDIGASGRAAMGECGRQFVAAHYARSALAETYRAVMSEAIEEYHR